VNGLLRLIYNFIHCFIFAVEGIGDASIAGNVPELLYRGNFNWQSWCVDIFGAG
jgi:hypothetical protein